MILAVDTSLGTAVALIDADGDLRAEASAADPLGHAEIIGDLLVEVLAQAGAGAVTHVVAGMGPGPFTGLRIGIAAARAFALGRDIPVIAVPSHFAAALAATETEPGPFAVVTDARRREVAITVFDGIDADGIPHVVAETVLVRAANADAHLDGIRRIDVATLSARDLARIGARALAAGRVLTDDEPLYLRNPDVTLPGAPKKVGT
ncbi:tRNA (adenosine(37)-N6)-threonylcarbamoyltransferase complex dimerization subunit type 1 TsaB [Microbacterium sp. KSW4-16]|uniref:tRNA (adenosine(37)-N6)-threonylcarbamoyltransferase complex dimerization subunit type 1 TsaB n=1 Tax=Microbacterium TaxID=33882 RepID=UPI0011BBAABF|nr:MULTISPECIES: tRNA (adenosine(37)-N6)-threonylcarbamoyltransferase complex dimerization subunit type 1 TsaB [Microbacterium]MCK8466866.1 tRNA (adenosine(37)-N6)-threonylcarbamoyltransferase complex dimerization subunit type 1 TsaB [Microbacterium aurugineum]QEA28745.1 tRNA (adenosine(37)-N6)-threonylcarbamoyltransferase complex dimerization subunit type 1 TsaB [Microbacterium sp. CBA3102]